MIKKNDFIWHIGFQGNTAIVNRRQKNAFRNSLPQVLLEAGYFRAAFCSALWESEVEKKEGAMDAFIQSFGQSTGFKPSTDELKRMMGVYQIPDSNLYIQQV